MQIFPGWKALNKRSALIEERYYTPEDLKAMAMDRDKNKKFEADVKDYESICIECQEEKDKASECKQCNGIVCDKDKDQHQKDHNCKNEIYEASQKLQKMKMNYGFIPKMNFEIFPQKYGKDKNLDILKDAIIQSIRKVYMDVWKWSGSNASRRSSYNAFYDNFKAQAIKSANEAFNHHDDFGAIKKEIVDKINNQYADIWKIAGPDNYHRANMANYFKEMKSRAVKNVSEI